MGSQEEKVLAQTRARYCADAKRTRHREEALKQPKINRPIGRSGQKLRVEYHVEPLLINFWVSTTKKGYRQGPGSRNIGESLVKATIS